MKTAEVIIYTDGSSRGNPGPGGWGAIVATRERVVELGGGERRTTNNKMELMAAIKSLRFVCDLGIVGTIDVRADSRYVINGITKWVFGWQKNGWRNTQKEEVANRELWEALALVVADVQMSGAKILWNYTPGHSGIPGNERADEIATAHADEKNIKLFDDARTQYGIDLVSNAPIDESKKIKKTPAEKTRQKAKAYSYLSLVNGKLMRHTTWAECEERVKGVKDTKFKKALSADDEREIIKAWGIK
jgi:ribonuclease HI